MTNLSRPLVSHLEGLPMSKLGIKASLHPSQFKDVKKELEFFIEEALRLKKSGATIVVNYVLAPGQFRDFPKYKRMFDKLGILLTANIFRGSFNGAEYPEAFEPEELSLMKEYLSFEPFIFDYQTHQKNPYGMKCVAGRYCVYIKMDGTVYNCPFALEKIGSIFDSELNAYSENCVCTANACECQWSIGLLEDIVMDYKRPKHFFGYEPRPEGETGTHPFL